MISETYLERKQLPEYLKALYSKDYIELKTIKDDLRTSAIEIFIINLMQTSNQFSAIDGYRLGTTKGFAALQSITSEYLNGQNLNINSTYIEHMHKSIRCFMPEIIKDTPCTMTKAKQLQEAHDFATNYILQSIKYND